MNRFCVTILLGLLMTQLAFADSDAPKKHHHRKTDVPIVKDDSQQVDINKATAVELMTVKGVGLKKATAIVEFRKQHGAFKNVDDLTQVKGFSVKTLAKIQEKNPGKLVAGEAVKMSDK